MRAASVELDLILACLRRALPRRDPHAAGVSLPPLPIDCEPEWGVFCALARRQEVVPLVYPELLERGCPALAAEWRSGWSSSQIRATVLAEVLDALAAAGVPAMPLKGPAMAERLFGDVDARLSADLDILVQPKSMPEAQAAIESIGFLPSSVPWTVWDVPLIRDGILIELHRALGRPDFCPIDAATAWKRSASGEFRGRSIRVMTPEDEILYLCYHLVRHDCWCLKWVADIGRALMLLARSGDGAALVDLAQSTRLEPMLLFCAAAVRELFETPVPPALSRTLDAQPAVCRKARRYFSRSLRLPPEKSPLGAWNFHAFEPSLMRRWRARFRALAPTRYDRAWARDHGVPAFLVWPSLPIARAARIVSRYGVAGTVQRFFTGTG